MYNSRACANYTWHSEESRVTDWSRVRRTEKHLRDVTYPLYLYLAEENAKTVAGHTQRQMLWDTFREAWHSKHRWNGMNGGDEEMLTLYKHMGMMLMTWQPHRQLWTHQVTVFQSNAFYKMKCSVDVDFLLSGWRCNGWTVWWTKALNILHVDIHTTDSRPSLFKTALPKTQCKYF